MSACGMQVWHWDMMQPLAMAMQLPRSLTLRMTLQHRCLLRLHQVHFQTYCQIHVAMPIALPAALHHVLLALTDSIITIIMSTMARDGECCEELLLCRCV